MTLQNRPKFVLRRSVKSLVVSTLFSSMTLYPAGESVAQQIKSVTVGVVERETIRDHVAVVGTLIAKEEIRVNALLGGKEVRSILVEVGAVVSKGQPLAVLDVEGVNLLLERNSVQLTRAAYAVAQEQSRVDVAAVTERETRKVVERSRSLVGKGAVSQQLLDEHENAFSRARSQLELAHQSLMLAEADRKLIERERAEISLTIERSTVRATEAGLVLSRNARVGAMTSSSGDPLFIVAKDGLIEMEASVSESSFVRLKEGMQAQVIVPGIDLPVQGRLRLSAAQIDPATRMGTVRLELDQSKALVPGAFVHGRIEIGQRSNVTVPATAIRSQNGGASVFVVEDGRAILRSVTLGSPTGSAIEVLTGVEEGEIVVNKSGSFLKSDEQIHAVPAPGSTAQNLSSLEVEGSVAQ
ncbi:efflux RND transporter periplasmic adaptor subunit [Rhizobium sp. PDO1-076]|uniref:efflux RND transporter periplasmic adaptor subunit n=1 Tax=Rhizobium sp. PDO1-076 TaxID=1125979 RepID=UPI001360B275|nr:efflux RND transporter periplasmic adaptor subunit [Rhizobium sp. PDO1-076]